MRRYFPHWDDLLLWVQDVRQSVAYTQRTRQNPFVGESFELEAMHQVAAEVPRRFGWWHDQLCVDMKSALLEMEGTRSTGRVALGAFYGGKSAGKDWRFIESVDYLRQLGALDESDPKRLRVILPNYLSGPNNCIEGSQMHTYCCKDECSGLVSEVEQGIAAPTGSVGDIARIVSQISSDTVDAPRNLTSELMSKLESVANRNGGRVPLHGRLFAQWMHHAFPSECPHPHVSGTTAPKTTKAFKKSGGKVKVTAEERAQHIASHNELTRSSANDVESLLWSDEEELLAYDDFNLQSSLEMGSSLYLAILIFLVLLGAMALSGSKGTTWAQERYMV